MFQKTYRQGIKPIIAELIITHVNTAPITDVLSEYVFNLLNKYAKENHFRFASFSKNQFQNDMLETGSFSTKFDTDDAMFLTKLSQHKFPKTVNVSCNVTHIDDNNIIQYVSQIRHNEVVSTSFESRPTTAEELRLLLPDRQDFYDKHDFIMDEHIKLSDDVSSKIYKSKTDFIKHELDHIGKERNK